MIPTYTVRSLAERWDCSEAMIRKMIKAGDLQCFTLGSLIRIRQSEVERIECNSPPTASNDSGEGSPSSGPKTQPGQPESPATGEGGSSTPRIELGRKRKRAVYGPGATIHHGPWAAS